MSTPKERMVWLVCGGASVKYGHTGTGGERRSPLENIFIKKINSNKTFNLFFKEKVHNCLILEWNTVWAFGNEVNKEFKG